MIKINKQNKKNIAEEYQLLIKDNPNTDLLTEASGSNSTIVAGWDEDLQAAIIPKWLYDEWEY